MNGRWQLVVLSLVSLLLALVAGMSLALGPAPQAALGGAPAVVSYQGQVTVGGSPYSGTGYFKFAVVDAAGTTTYWSNDGTSTGGGQPTNGVSLPVTNGLFNVLLGDTSLSGMTQPLSAAVFGSTERYLRVWFSQDGLGYAQLSQDRRIAAVPYALQAQDADTLDGQQASDLALPTSALVLGRTPTDTTLIDAGFSYTGLKAQVHTWTTRESMLTPRLGLAAVAVNGVVYAIGGSTPGGPYLKTVEAYDPAMDSWTTMAPMPTGRWYLAAAAVDGVIYAIGGESDDAEPGLYEETVEAYNPTTNAWDNTLEDMPTGRRQLAAAVVEGMVYAIGGYNGSILKTNEVYDPVADTWDEAVEDMPTQRYGLAAVAVDGVIYAIGGWSGSEEAVVEAYDPDTDAWDNALAPMPTARFGLAAAVVDGVIYAVGGDSASIDWERAIEAYDPATDSWARRPPMPTGRTKLAAAAVDGAIHVIGGRSEANPWETANEAYTPVLYVYSND